MKTLLAKLSLSKKLLAGPVLVTLILFVSGVISVLGLRAQQSAIDEIFNGRFKSYQEAAAINESITDAHGSMYRLIAWARANYDPNKIDALGKTQLERIDSVIATIGNRVKLAASEGEKERYTKALAQAVEYRKAVFSVVDFAGIDLNTATMAMGTVEDKYSVFAETLHAFQRDGAERSQASFDSAMAAYAKVLILFVVVFGAGLALSALVMISVNRLVSAPIRATTDVIGILAEGDLTRDVPVESTDELGRMAGSLNTMIGNLRGMIGGIIEASATLAGASTQISSSTEEMAAGSQEQNSQVDEVASAVASMAKTIVENSKNAGDAARTALQAREAAKRGGEVVEKTVGGMKRIAEVVHHYAGTVGDLGKSSDQIGQIISVIDDIADQTNLLALNAAIEAARAGEQGRGFAVVADEVRKLAERTTKATSEIAEMIRKIQSDTKDAVASMAEGRKNVTEGIELADRAGTSLSEIVEISQRVTDMVTQIAASSEEQSATGEEITRNVEAIRSVTSETAMGEQQIARAAEDLNRLTEHLQQLTAKFRLSGTDPGAPPLAGKSGLEKSALAVRANGKLVPHRK
jgi:methyl-accepting chemotaxis protein